MLILDVILLLLIIICIIYCFKLSKKIADLHNMKEDFSNKIKDLNKTILKVESNINNLVDLSKKASEDLNNIVNKSEKLSDDLILINKIGSGLAKRLEKNIDISTSKISAMEATLQKYSNINRNEEEEVVENTIDHEDIEETDNNGEKQGIFRGIMRKMMKTEDNLNLDQMSYYNRLRNIKTKR